MCRKKEDEGYGFSVRGDAPVVVAGVETASLAHVSKVTQPPLQWCKSQEEPKRYGNADLSVNNAGIFW
jgi:hypothetical protein